MHRFLVTPSVWIGIYMSFVQKRQVLNDTYIYNIHFATPYLFSYLFYCNENFYKCFSYLDTLILKISCKFTKYFQSYEVWHQNIRLLGLGYKNFSKKLHANICFITHKNIFCTHLFAMKIYNKVLHAYPHNP